MAVLLGIVTSRDIDFIVEKKDEGASISLRYIKWITPSYFSIKFLRLFGLVLMENLNLNSSSRNLKFIAISAVLCRLILSKNEHNNIATTILVSLIVSICVVVKSSVAEPEP